MWWLDAGVRPSQEHDGSPIQRQARPESAGAHVQPAPNRPDPLVSRKREWAVGEADELRRQLLRHERELRQRQADLTSLKSSFAHLGSSHATELKAAGQLAEKKLSHAVQRHTSEMERLQSEHAAEKQRVADRDAECASLKNRIAQLEAELSQKSAEANRTATENLANDQRLREQLALAELVAFDRDTTIRRLRSKIDRRDADHAQRCSRLQDFVQQTLIKAEQNHAHEAQQLREALRASELTAAEQKHELADLQDRHTALQHSHAGEIADLSRQHSIETERLAMALQISEKKAAECDELSLQMEQCDIEFEQFRIEIEAAERDMFERDQRVQELETKLTDQADQHAIDCEELKRFIESFLADSERHHADQVAAIKEQHSTATQQLETKLRVAQEKLVDRDELRFRIDEQDTEMEHLRLTVESADRHSMELGEIAEELETELTLQTADQMRRCAELRQSFDSSLADIQRQYISRVAHLEDKLAKESTQAASALQSAEQKVSDRDTLVTQLSEQDQELKRLRRTLQSADDESRELRDLVRGLQAELISQSAGHSRKCQELQKLADARFADAETRHASVSGQLVAAKQNLEQSLAAALNEHSRLHWIVDQLQRTVDQQKTQIAESVQARISAQGHLAQRMRTDAMERAERDSQIASLQNALEQSEKEKRAVISGAEEQRAEHARLLVAMEKSLTTVEQQVSQLETVADDKCKWLSDLRRDRAESQYHDSELEEKHAAEVAKLTQALDSSEQQCSTLRSESVRVAVIAKNREASLHHAQQRSRQLLVMHQQLRKSLHQRLETEMGARAEAEASLQQAIDDRSRVQSEAARTIAANDQLARENEELREAADAVHRSQLLFQNRVLANQHQNSPQQQQLDALQAANDQLTQQREIEVASLRDEIARIGCVAVSQKQRISDLQTQLSTVRDDRENQESTEQVVESVSAQWQLLVRSLEQNVQSLQVRLSQEAAARRKAEGALRRYASGEETDAQARETWLRIEIDEQIVRLTRRLKAAETMRNIERNLALDHVQRYRNKIKELQRQAPKRNAA